MKIKVLLCLVLLSGLALAQQNALVVQQQFSAAGTSAWFPVAGYTNFTLTWSQVGSTTVTGCAVQVDSSPIASGSGTAGGLVTSQSCNSGGTTTVTSVAASYGRINVTAITAGTIKITFSAVNGALSKGGGTYTGTAPIVVAGTAISCPTCGTSTGNVQTSGTITAGQIAIWATGLSIKSAAVSGDGTLSSSGVLTNTGLNGVTLSGLASGFLYNTTGTGVPTIGTGAQLATLVQGLTGCNTATYVFTPQASDCVAPGGGGVTSVSGTANQIASTGGTTPVLSITNPFDPPGEVDMGATSSVAWPLSPLYLQADGVTASLLDLGTTAGGNDAGLQVGYVAGSDTSQNAAFILSTGVATQNCAAPASGKSIFCNSASTGNAFLSQNGDTPSQIARLGSTQTFTAAETFSGAVTNSHNGGASNSASTFSGTVFTGGTGTTTFPLFYINQGAAVTSFSTAGTELGFNGPSGFTGNFLDFHVNGGASVGKLDYQGNLTVASCTGCGSGGPGTGTQYDPAYWATTSTLGSIAPASGYDSVPQYMSGTTTSGAFTAAPAFGPAGIPVDTSNPATLLATDRGSLLLWTSGTALALPAMVGGAFANNDVFALKNLAGATLTITPNAGAGDTINGSASDAVLANFYVKVTSNGSGAWYDAQTPTKQAFGSTCLNFLAWSTTTGFSCSGTMGASGTAGTLAMFPASGNFTTTLGSAATASNTVLFPATVPVTNHGVHCVTASTTCTLTDNGYVYNAIPTADLAATGTFVFNNAANTFSTGLQTFTAATISLPSSAAYAPTTAALFGYDSTNNRLVFGNGTTTAIPTFVTATPTTNVLSKFSGAIGLEANSSITDNATLISTTEGISVAPTSTSQVGAIINNPTSTSVNIANFQVNGTNEAQIGNTGVLTLGAATGCTPGSGGWFCSNEGTDVTPASTVFAMNGNSGDHGGHWSENGATIQHLPQAFVLAGSAYTNATTTFSNVAGGSGPTLSFPVNASVSYTATCYIMWQGSATTTGPKFQWTGPASPTAVAASMHSPVTTTTYIDATATAFSSSMADTGTITTATNFMAVVTIGLNNGTTAGTVTLQAAANGTGTLTIQPGSYCIAQ